MSKKGLFSADFESLFLSQGHIKLYKMAAVNDA